MRRWCIGVLLHVIKLHKLPSNRCVWMWLHGVGCNRWWRLWCPCGVSQQYISNHPWVFS